MSEREQERELARRFFEVVPLLLHSIGSGFRTINEGSGQVTMAQFRSMMALHRGPRSLNELAAMHEVAAPTMSRLISTLVERGWVQREPAPTDRRQVVLGLTPTGEELLEAMSERGREQLAAVLVELSEEERAGLDRALGGLGRVLAARRAQARESCNDEPEGPTARGQTAGV